MKLKNPLSSLKEKREEEKRKKEEERKRKEEEERRRREEEEKRERRSLLILCAALAVLFLFIGVMAILFPDTNSDSSTSTSSAGEVEKEKTTVDETNLNTDKSNTSEKANQSQQSDAVTAGDNKDTTKPKNTSKSEQKKKSAFTEVVDYDISCQSDYSHVNTDSITLGNNEKAILSITATPSGLEEDDFIISYDESMISASFDLINNDFDNETVMEMTISALNPGSSEINVSFSYDKDVYGDEARVTTIGVKALDDEEGRVVYTTPTGEKYHLSADCAGENAQAIAMYDARALELEPCGKCAN